jgi:hypothetical protein
MKKIMMTLAAVCVAATMNAQGYIGGSLAFSSNTEKGTTVQGSGPFDVTTSAFAIAPEIGYNLDDKMSIGLAFGFGTAKRSYDYKGNGTNISIDDVTSSTVTLKPYLRYQVLTFGKANIFVDGGVNFGLQSAKDMKPAMDLGLFVTPGISFDVNDKWAIVAKLDDMFSFGYHKSQVPDVDNAPDPDTSIKAGLSTGGFNVGSLSFGVFYKF